MKIIAISVMAAVQLALVLIFKFFFYPQELWVANNSNNNNNNTTTHVSLCFLELFTVLADVMLILFGIQTGQVPLEDHVRIASVLEELIIVFCIVYAWENLLKIA
jgi:hypothetical protein